MEATAQAFFEWLASRKSGPSPELRDWLDEWLELCGRRGLRPSTIASYRTMLRLYIDDPFARTPLSDITASQINRLYGRLLREGRCDGNTRRLGRLRGRTNALNIPSWALPRRRPGCTNDQSPVRAGLDRVGATSERPEPQATSQ